MNAPQTSIRITPDRLSKGVGVVKLDRILLEKERKRIFDFLSGP